MPTPLPYHVALHDLIRNMDRHVWNWFANQRMEPAAIESLRLELLKSTYRLSQQSHGILYDAVNAVATKLGVELPITLYQSQSAAALNAHILFATDEVHIVLSGDVSAALNEVELQALFGHELAHHILNTLDSGAYLQTWDILRASCNEGNVHPAFLNSFRHWTLYTEIFCDRVSLEVVGERDAVISMLVKMAMGVASVVPKDFLAQSHEVLDTAMRASKLGSVTSEGITHPEAYIRAAALDLFYQNDVQLEQKLTTWIEGSREMASLDLIQQREVSQATRQLIRRLLRHPGARTELMMSHARLFFEEFSKDECDDKDDRILLDCLNGPRKSESVANYLCFVILDFASADREIDELLLANALSVAESLELKSQLILFARKELKLRKNQIEQCDRRKAEILRSSSEPSTNS